MCIRYSAETGEPIKWSKYLNCYMPLADWNQGEDTYPGYIAPIVTPMRYSPRTHSRQLELGQWGLIPAWAPQPTFGKKNAYNARAETLTEKPTFRTAFEKRRCIIPCTSFYERKDGRWIRFQRLDGNPMQLAGLYEASNRHVDKPTFAMITTEPNDTVIEYQDRMPVVLDERDVDIWMAEEADPQKIRALLTPCPPHWLVTEDAGPIETGRRKKLSDDETGQGTFLDDF